MALKQNRILLAVLCLACFSSAFAQEEEDTFYQEAAPLTEEVQTNYNPEYHFHDSDRILFTQSEPEPALDSAAWKDLVRNMTFDEAKKKPVPPDSLQNKTPAQQQSHNVIPDLKYVLIGLALLALGFAVWKFVPRMRRNKKNRPSLLIDLDELDEAQIRSLEVESALEQALREDDYRKAYRLRYLGVLKELIAQNLIFYKKEKTNYEYLLQLTGREVYEPFRMLTFNFDGIWYGDLFIDKEKYETLETHFDSFNRAIKG